VPEERGKQQPEDTPKIVHRDADLWNLVADEFKGVSSEKYEEALEQQRFCKAKSMLLHESRKGCGLRSTTEHAFPELLNKRTLIWGPETGDAMDHRPNLDASRQGRRVVVVEIFPWIKSSQYGCKVPQFAELLTMEKRTGQVQESMKYADFLSFRKSEDWKGLNKWDWECYGQIEPSKALIYGECVICPLYQKAVKPAEPYSFACQGLRELGKHAMSKGHQKAAAWMEARREKPVLRIPKPIQRSCTLSKGLFTKQEQNLRKLEAEANEPGQRKISFGAHAGAGTLTGAGGAGPFNMGAAGGAKTAGAGTSAGGGLGGAGAAGAGGTGTSAAGAGGEGRMNAAWGGGLEGPYEQEGVEGRGGAAEGGAGASPSN
jgi:hypothetical protein